MQDGLRPESEDQPHPQCEQASHSARDWGRSQDPRFSVLNQGTLGGHRNLMGASGPLPLARQAAHGWEGASGLCLLPGGPGSPGSVSSSLGSPNKGRQVASPAVPPGRASAGVPGCALAATRLRG